MGMTWSAVHTIPYSTAGDWHTAFQYLFDTFLPTISGQTPGLHPDSSVFKRKLKRTSAHLYGGASYDEYFWCSWLSTTPTQLSFYRDGTYTSAPGDLCTDTTNVYTSALPSPLGSFRFWTSSVNPRAALMTKGKTVIYWEPGWSHAAHYEVGTWTGTAATCIRSQIFPYTGNNVAVRTGPPDLNTGTSTSEYNWGPAPGMSNTSANHRGGSRIDMNIAFLNHNSSSNAYPGIGTEVLFIGCGDDVGFYRSDPSTSTSRNISGTAGLLALASGKYYLFGVSGTSNSSVVWEMGTSEPDLS